MYLKVDLYDNAICMVEDTDVPGVLEQNENDFYIYIQDDCRHLYWEAITSLPVLFEYWNVREMIKKIYTDKYKIEEEDLYRLSCGYLSI